MAEHRWAEDREAALEILRASAGRKVLLRVGEEEIGFYVVGLWEDSEGLSLEGHYAFAAWQSWVAWTSCGIALLLILGIPVLAVWIYVYQASLYFLSVYLTLPVLYLISMSLFSPRSLIAIESIAAVREAD